MSDGMKLKPKDKFELVVNAGLQTIPYIGGLLPHYILDTNKSNVFKELNQH